MQIYFQDFPRHPQNDQRHERPTQPKESPLKAVHLRYYHIVRSRYAVRSNYGIATQELTIGGAPLDILYVDCVAFRLFTNRVRVVIEYAITLHLAQGVRMIHDALLRDYGAAR